MISKPCSLCQQPVIRTAKEFAKSLNNLVALCPNHHREFDRGLIRMGPAGFEPAS